MSLHARSDERLLPVETVQVAHAAFPKGNPYLTLRDELGPLYTDQTFAALFAHRGRPAEAPGCLALVTVLQYAEGLSDRQAAEAVRGRIDWKYVLGLELTDPGFDYSVLSEFRTRLIAGGAEQQLLDTLLAGFKAHGLVKARGRQRTDSTHVLAAIRSLNRLEVVGETMRQALNGVAAVAADWLQPRVPVDWFQRYVARFEQYRLPKAETERQALAVAIGVDGYQLLSWATAAEAGPEVRTHPALEVLRQVWVQQYYLQDDQVYWRAADNLPPAERLIQSPYDPEARYSRKRQTAWTGYKVHLTETCDEDLPHLITQVETTVATTPDHALTETIQATLAAHDLLPHEHLLDAGYVDAGLLVFSQAQDVDVIGPVLADTSWQARAKQGFEGSCFAIDWDQQTVTCPRGCTSQIWSESTDTFANPVIHVRFTPADCQACPARPQCTQAAQGPRALKLRARRQHEALQRARQRQTTPEFKKRYAARAGVEGTLSQGTRRLGLRRARYIGHAKIHLQHVLTAAALNLVRLAAWLQDIPRAATRVSPFAALAQAAA